MDNFLTGLRVLDIEHGLREIQPTAIIEGEMANTLLLGKAANLALHIRGLNVLDDMTALRYGAAEMGIRSTELDSVLRELATLGWVRLRDSGAKINRVEVLVPELRAGFDTIGQRWLDCGPTEIEQASVATLAEAIQHPIAYDDLTGRLGIDREAASIVVDIGSNGSYLQTHRIADGEKLVHSPLFYDGNPERAHAVVERFGDDTVKGLVAQVRARQGTPCEQIDQGVLLEAAISAGIVLAPSVKDKRFAFLPQRGLGQHESVILDKARAILSCVRYGQHFADITKIHSPSLIISVLIDRKKLKPHSEHAKQYGLLVKKQVGTVAKTGARFQFQVLDTDDNMKALQVARDILETGEGVHQSIGDDTQLSIINPSASYTTPTIERVRLNKRVRMQGKADDRTIATISNLIRGARSV